MSTLSVFAVDSVVGREVFMSDKIWIEFRFGFLLYSFQTNVRVSSLPYYLIRSWEEKTWMYTIKKNMSAKANATPSAGIRTRHSNSIFFINNRYSTRISHSHL